MEKISVDDLSQALCLFIKSSIVDKKIPVEPFTSFHQLGIDSLSIIEIVLFIERKFNVALPEEELIPENFSTANALAQCTYKYLAK